MPTGIPCCKEMTITIGPNTMDCGIVPNKDNNLTDLVWTLTNGVSFVNTGDATASMAGAGNSGTFSFSGTTGEADGFLGTKLCNNTPSPVTVRFTFVVNYNLTQDFANCIAPPFAGLSSANLFSGNFWSQNGGSGTDNPTFDAVLPACTISDFGFYMAGSFNCATNTCAFDGTFTVALLP